MSNHKFKVGDKVIRVQDMSDILGVGYIGTVTCVSQFGHIKVDDHPYGYFHYKNFEHYVEQPAVDSEAVLTPLKVFEHILAGTPLEYRLKGKVDPVWYTLGHPNTVGINSVRQFEFRVKPQTVKVNGIDVPAPVKLSKGTLVYYPDIRRVDVQQGYVVTSGMGNYWATEEDAQAVLDAILTSFSK